MSLPFLQNFGLTDTEAEIYELLLHLGEVPAQIVAKESGLKRPTTYKMLYSLVKKGLVTTRNDKKKIHFQVTPPATLLTLADERYHSLDRARRDLQSMLPELTSTYTTNVEKPIIRVYEGYEGTKKANLEMLAEKKEILAYVYTDKSIDRELESFWKKYYAIRKRDKIYVRSIAPNTPAEREYKKRDKEELRETRLIPVEKFPITIEKNIVGNKVGLFSRRGDVLISTVIENEKIANTERAIFELAWSGAERYLDLG